MAFPYVSGKLAKKYIINQNAIATYWINRNFLGRGIDITALKDFLKIEQFRTIFAHVAFDNYGSQKVLEKCGFLRIGIDIGFANAQQTVIEEYIYNLAGRSVINRIIKSTGNNFSGFRFEAYIHTHRQLHAEIGKEY